MLTAFNLIRRWSIHTSIGVLALSCLTAFSTFANFDDECEVDECITTTAKRVSPCPEGWRCFGSIDRFSDSSIDCWRQLTGSPNARLSAPYGESRPKGPHNGIDIAVPTGTPVYAAKTGVVNELEGELPVGDRSTANGNFVRIDYDDGTQGVFLHLKSVSVDTGATVKAGQKVGESNDTGSSSGPHLHYSSYKNQSDREAVDPQLEHGDC